MKRIHTIRELIWPLLESGSSPTEKKDWKETIEAMDEKAVTVALDFAQKQMQSEEDRNKTVESKSIVFLGSISVVCSILLGALASIVRYEERNLLLAVSMVLLLVTSIYFLTTIFYSIKALERRQFARLSPEDFLHKGTECESKRKILLEIIAATAFNSERINEKTNSMVLAQEYFKRALASLFASFVIVTTLYFLCSKAKQAEERGGLNVCLHCEPQVLARYLRTITSLASLSQGSNGSNLSKWPSVDTTAAFFLAADTESSNQSTTGRLENRMQDSIITGN